MKPKSVSLMNNFDDILSVTQKPHKTIDNLFELNLMNESRKILLQIFGVSSPINFPMYSSNYLEIQEQFIDQSETLNLILEPFLNDLSTEIEQRIKVHSYFEEADLWKVLIMGITCLSELHLKGKTYGNLDLCSFVLMEDQEAFTVKLLTPEILLLSEQNQKERNQVYFSFEELKALKTGKVQKKEEKMENDIFHLGLALLEMGTFISVTSCYDWETMSINFKFIEKKIEIVESKYSKELAFLIKIMLNIDHKKRPTIKELAILIRKFEVLEGFYEKQEIRTFVQKNLNTNICGKCVENIRKRKEEAIDIVDRSDNSSLDWDVSRKMHGENEKEWLNIQKKLTKNQHSRSVLKSIDNMQY